MMLFRLPCLAFLLPASSARAEPPPAIDVARCETLGAELRGAITAEIDAIAAEREVSLGGRTIMVACPDAVNAVIEILPAPSTGPLLRRLHLGDIPAGLRVRLVALATAELADVAFRLQVTAAPPPVSGSLLPIAAQIDQPAATPPLPNLADRSAASAFAVTPRAGARMFGAQGPWFVEAGADVAIGSYELGVVAATGNTDDVLGRLRGYLVAIAGTVRVACTGDRVAVCLGARGEAGVAIVTAEARLDDVRVANARAPYIAGAGDVATAYRMGRWTLALTATFGWSEGLVSRAGDRVPIRIDGMLVGGSLAVRWQR
jgi:hypothetical protein